MDPGDFAAESLAELDRAWIQCPSRGGGPQRELIAVAPALVAVVAVQGDVDRGEALGTPTGSFGELWGHPQFSWSGFLPGFR